MRNYGNLIKKNIEPRLINSTIPAIIITFSVLVYEVFFIIIIASIVKFINRGLGENLISHSTKLTAIQ